ncbi:MAG: PD-(D/E)XK nuclease family protein [Elusimicrobiales bacterium]|nr:PD-(D/E)XK nuclease family protein [Elusimicrobiales bacterium]
MIFDPYELNYSKINTYLNCPLLYKHIYVDRKRVPLTPLASRGISLHKALAAYHAAGTLLDDLLACYDENWLGAGYGSSQEQMEHYLAGKRLLENFWLLERDRKSLIYGVEKEFEFPHKKWKMKGTIDRIDRHPSGEYEIIDYKTGPELRGEAELSASLQLGIYCAGVRHAFGIEPARITWWFLAHSKRVSLACDPSGEERVLEQFSAAGEKIVSGDFAPRHEFCGECGLAEHCPGKRGGDLPRP